MFVGGVSAGGTSGGDSGGSGGGLVLIEERATDRAEANITFSAIPATYRDLQLRIMGRGDKVAQYIQLYARFNGDAAANYDGQYAQSSGAASVAEVEVLGAAQAFLGWLPAANALAGVAGFSRVEIGDYANALFQKLLLFNSAGKLNNTGNNQIHQQGFMSWRGTAAIESITVFPDTGNFIAGTVASLYGVPRA